MKSLKYFYIICAVIGTIAPWFFFGRFFTQEGLNIPLFIKSLFVNGAAGGFSVDVLISILVFWVWSYIDAGQKQINKWWVVLPAGFTVGLSLALPLYLFLRSDD